MLLCTCAVHLAADFIGLSQHSKLETNSLMMKARKSSHRNRLYLIGENLLKITQVDLYIVVAFIKEARVFTCPVAGLCLYLSLSTCQPEKEDKGKSNGRMTNSATC